MDDRSTRALSVRNLRKRYKDVVAVDGIDLDVRTGECFGLLGPNGAGKTTTIEICEGLTEADSGDVEVLGLRWASDGRTLRQRLGIQLQETQLADKLTVAETLRLFRSFYASGPTVARLIALVRLDEKRDARLASLSGGQKQRLALACALVGDPDLLFLDEPTTGLDPQARRQVWDLIAEFKSSGRTIVLTTHYMEEAERLCDRVAIVDHGRVIALGTPAELIAQLGGENIVEFQLADPGVVLNDGALSRLPSVQSASGQDGIHSLAVEQPHVALPAVLALLQSRGLALASLTTRHATLEDVFVSLTGRHLREADNGHP
jgi:ABC-2 type transport system ATP-binding protein